MFFHPRESLTLSSGARSAAARQAAQAHEEASKALQQMEQEVNPTNGLKEDRKKKITDKKTTFSNFVGSIFLNFGPWTLKFC